MSNQRPCGNFKRNYQEDEAIFKTGFIKIVVILFLLALLFFPLIADDYILYTINLVLIAIIGAHGINILTGYTGQISLGHGAFIGIGGYTTAVMMNNGFSFWIALACAGLAAAGVGLIFSLPVLRLKGFYLAMSTLAAQFLMAYLFMRFSGITGGASGIYLERPSIFGFVLESDANFYYLTLLFAVIATFATMNLFRTRVGRALIAIRSKDIAAEIIGINLFRYKVTAFVISSFYAGIAGALLASYVSIITPRTFGLEMSIDYLAIIIIGGLGTIRGAVYGASFVILVPEVLKISISELSRHIEFLDGFPSVVPATRLLIFGAAIVAIILIEQKGMAKMWTNIKTYWKLWPYSH